MGKYLGLSEMGTYGLVTAFVMILISALGLRLDYVVSREIVDVSPLEMTVKMRDQALVYGLNYIAFGFVVAFLYFYPGDGLDNRILLYTYVLSIFESFAATAAGNLVSVGRPILSNALFFIRSALWVIPVIALGYLYPEYRTADIIFSFWLGGILISILVNLFVWRGLPWGNVFSTPVDWKWVRDSIKRCFFLWLAVMASSASSNIDRFVVEGHLGREAVGLVSYYSSFVMSVSALMASGVFAFTYPALIRHYKQKQIDEFKNEARKSTIHATLFCTFVCVAMGATIPLFGHFFDQPEFVSFAPVFWMMLLGVLIKTATESLYYVLYAWGEDRALWVTSFLFLGLSIVSNMVFVSMFGLPGIGYSAIVTAVFLALWRFLCVWKTKDRHIPHIF